MKKSKVFWAVILTVAAVALIFFAVAPSFTFGTTIPAWKLILCIFIFIDIVRRLIIEPKLSDKFSIFIQLALIFILLKKNIAVWCSLPDDFANNWLIIIAACFFTTAVNLIFGTKFVKGDKPVHDHSNSHKNMMSEATVYIDISENSSHNIKNRFGSMNIYLQNTDVDTDAAEFTLYIDNKFGETEVHVPENFTVDMKMISVCGEAAARPDLTSDGKRICITGKNLFGETTIVSP